MLRAIDSLFNSNFFQSLPVDGIYVIPIVLVNKRFDFRYSLRVFINFIIV